MVTVKKREAPSREDGSLMITEMTGLSTDVKPTGENIGSNSLFLELDTGNLYYYDGAAWNLLQSGSGGGSAPTGGLQLYGPYYASPSSNLSIAASSFDGYNFDYVADENGNQVSTDDLSVDAKLMLSGYFKNDYVAVVQGIWLTVWSDGTNKYVGGMSISNNGNSSVALSGQNSDIYIIFYCSEELPLMQTNS